MLVSTFNVYVPFSTPLRSRNEPDICIVRTISPPQSDWRFQLSEDPDVWL